MNVLTVDIGASSGRVINTTLLPNKKFALKELHRFENGIIKEGKNFYWDINSLVEEVITGIGKADSSSISVGIDTWAVDFILLDEKKEIIGHPVSYRDPRTKGMMEEMFKIVPKEEIYKKTGIQFLEFNTIFQLLSLNIKDRDKLDSAKHFMFIPDYLHYKLTDKITNEYTNSTTSSLINLKSGLWDKTLLNSLDIEHLFPNEPVSPGTNLGKIKKELGKELGLEQLEVIVPATHDTASAIVAVPTTKKKNWAYISSGTWSLMGIESSGINCEKALEYNFTNEGGMEKRTRTLKNIMGLWLIQNIKKEFEDRFSFAEIVKESKKSVHFESKIDANDIRFFNPNSMRNEIINYCQETSQALPETIGEFGKCIFESLAISYSKTMKELEIISGEKIEEIYIIGGGCQNDYLNQLCADYTGVTVYSGPVEATAIGNAAVQFISKNIIKDVEEARAIIKNSFEIKRFEPKIKE